MNFIKNLFQFYINASIHVALAVYALLRVTEIYFGLTHDYNLGLFVFFAAISGYNFIKYAGVAKFYHKSLTQNLRVIQIFSFLCFLLMCYFAWQLAFDTILLFIPMAMITLLYAIPFLAGFQKSLREVSYLKIFLVALVWSGTTSSIPLIVNEYDLNVNIILIFIQRLLFVVVLTLPFEIRDVNLDIENVKTLPQKIGIPQTKKVGFTLILFSLVFEFIITDDLITRNIFLAVCFALMMLLMRSTNKQPKYFSSFWVEAIPIFWLLLLFLFG